MFNKTLTIAIVILAFTLKGHAQESNAKLNQLFDQFYKESNALDPMNATFNSVADYNDLLPADDEEWLKKKHDFCINYLKQLKGIDKKKLNKDEKISYEILESNLQSTLKIEKHHPEYMPINQMFNVPMIMAVVGAGTSVQPFKTVKDYDNWLKRCKAFTKWADVAIDNMRKGIKTGIVLPKALVVKIIPQFQELEKNSDESSFYMPIKNFPESFTESDKNRLSNEFKQTIPNNIIVSMAKLSAFLQNEYLPKARLSSGINSLPNGKEMYKDYILLCTTTNKDPEEVYKLGLSEVARITSEMEKIKTTIGFKGTLNEMFEFMKTDKQFMPFKSEKEVVDAYQTIYETIKPKLPTYFGIIPKTPFEVRKTESFRADAAPAQYLPGDLLSNRPGVFYIAIIDPTKVNTCNMDMESLFLHEAIPGHHFQFSLQAENTGFPEFRKKYMNSAYVEGWALYTESLGKDLGVYTTPYHQLGALGMEIHRAIRLVTDAGLHTGKMNREEAIKYIMDNEPLSEKNAICLVLK